MNESNQMLGGFRLLGTLKGSGDGRQGTVYRAACVQPTVPGVAVGEIVVLKTMKDEDDSGRSFEKLKRRTEILSSLDHPNILRYRGCFSDVGPFNALHVVVTDLLEGETLKERLSANPSGLDADEALRIVDGALAGLCRAAKAGIVHRDIKPGNIFLCRDGSVKLIDFELGRSANAAITASGSFVGTFNYMAPEFSDDTFRGDETSDVFSMGVVLHEALTGVLPYARDKDRGEQADFAFLSRWKQRMEGLCVIHVKSSVKRLLFAADGVLHKALADDRKTRYASAEEFRKGLAAIRFKELDNESGNAYRLLRVIGKGGFGEVFKARDRNGRLVAVKRLLDERYGTRFAKEARIMRKLDDPAFVRFVDYFEKRSAGRVEAYLVMDFLPGMPGASLRDAIKSHPDEPLPCRDVLKAFALYARGLAMMHLRGIYHRDIKPSNLYYPDGDLSRAAIMDLGIARDVNGSVTTDQVPGTLDYMPYEIAFGTSRGDAAMDIYALGLSLYEAVTSKTAFPRLPAGRGGVEMFLQRAKARIQPNFDAPQVVRRPALLRLLRDMTEQDSSMRLRDADVVRHRIEALLLGEDGKRPVAPPRGAVLATPPPRPQPMPSVPVAPPRPSSRPRVVQDRDPDTGATQNTDFRARRRPKIQNLGGLAARGVFVAVLVGGAALGVKLGWKPLRSCWTTVTDRISESRRKKIETAHAEKQRLDEMRERKRIAAKCETAELEASAVVKRYADVNCALVSADLAAEEWRTRWCRDSEVETAFRTATNSFAQARRERRQNDERRRIDGRQKAARREGEAVCASYGEPDVALARADELAAAWRQKWKAQLDAALYAETDRSFSAARQRHEDRRRADENKRRDERMRLDDLERAEREAAAQAQDIVAAFADESILRTKTEARYVQWQGAWGRYAGQAFYGRLVQTLETARRERGLLESGRTVSAECDRWLANIETVSEFNVKNWRDNLTQAELELKKALNPDNPRMSERDAERVKKRIDACRKWKVGVIENKTSLAVRFGDGVIAPTSSGTVIFKGGFPSGAAITCEGCEPIRMREDLFDGRTFTLLPRMLVSSKGGVRAVVPEFGKDVICLVDGVEAHPGEITLSGGAVHHVLYRRRAQTYAGIDDYKEQDVVFNANAGSVVRIPPPQAEWTLSREFTDAAKSAKQVARGRKIVAQVEKLLAPEPVSDRRARLEKVHGILSNWETPSALASLGISVESRLREKYDLERRRIRGMIRNATAVAATVKTDCAEVSIASGQSALVTFEEHWPGDAYVALPDYEFVFLPHVVSEFDGREFVVDAAKLIPTPVRVVLPPLEKDVSCRVNDKVVEGEIRLRPGSYDCIYAKPDCVAQKFAVTVRIGEKMTLPLPKAWEPSGAMSRFSAALDSFNSGAVSAAKAIASEVGTIEDPGKRKELEDLKKAIELREQMERTQDAN